jgi:hypothetical protein
VCRERMEDRKLGEKKAEEQSSRRKRPWDEPI